MNQIRQENSYIRQLVIRSDRMSASIVVSRPPRSAVEKTKKDIVSYLASQGVVYGVLDQAIDHLFDHELFDQEVEVARGISVVHGKDASLHRIYHKQQNKGIDVNLDPNIVLKDDIVYEVTAATSGSHGVDIFGHVQLANPGKKSERVLGEGLIFSEDGFFVKAARSGYLLESDDKIDIVDQYVIEGDVSRFSGHIVFPGTVHVKGDVRTGYTITADQEVIVDGIIEAATIIAGGNIVIRKGVIGAGKAVLAAKGDITAAFIENALSVESGKSIYTHMVLNSNLYAMDQVIVSGEGQIIGGKTVAHNLISCKIAGFKSYVKTELVVGLTKDRMDQMDETANLIRDLKKRNEEVRKNMIYLEKKVSETQDPQEHETLNSELNLQQLTFNYNVGVLNELHERLIALQNEGNQVARILADQEIFPMTKIRINHLEADIQEHMKHRCIFAEDDEILIIDYDDDPYRNK